MEISDTEMLLFLMKTKNSWGQASYALWWMSTDLSRNVFACLVGQRLID